MAEPVLVGDVGGTNARFALADPDRLTVSDFARFATADHAGLAEAARAYLDGRGVRVRRAAIAVAGPVTGRDIRFTNLGWSFRRDELAVALGLDELRVLNDFEAVALSLPHLGDGDLVALGGGPALPERPRVALGPGTGLGLAALVPGGGGFWPVAGEAGHMGLAGQTRDEQRLLAAIAEETERVSVETVLSGPGLEALYRALARLDGREAAASAEAITRDGLAGTDPLAAASLERFIVWLGRFAGDAALMLGARGGVYLGGGIAPRLRMLLEGTAFRAAFEDKGPMRDYARSVPAHLIVAGDAPLRGAAAGLRGR